MQNPVSREKRQVCSCMACAERNSKNPLNIGKDIPYEAVCKVFKFLKIARKRIKVRYSRQGQLYCKNGYLIHIDKDGRISGTTSHKDQYSALEFQSLGAGKVIIKGVVTGRYLAINDQGLLYSTDTFHKEAIMEEKQEENFYHSFNSHRYRQPGWYVALRRNGQLKLCGKGEDFGTAIYSERYNTKVPEALY
ncbi:predicted protein [Nematostella vectensis]|uniref:Fibroblast growth factor n=1 Tax=Nematostella vectensis TaxID=45351 RepID=A7SI24_NEMVE|nr:predicted protein [Nematostella vectensis]|eukprot:XP_001628739.1 predicted protein [Nematostella vectensis]